jgi:phage terminase large subunit-like protein
MKYFDHKSALRAEKSIIHELKAVKWEDIEKELGIKDYSSLTEEELKKFVEIKTECERREKEYGILYYEPQQYRKDGSETYQQAFHKDDRKIRLILGGNQTGKTEAAVAEGIWIALGIHPWKKIPIPNKGRVIASDLDKGIGEVIGAKYEKMMPKKEIRRIVKYSGGQMKKIFLHNGSTIEFLSYEQDTKSFEGWVGNWAQWDEPPPKDKYIATLRGLMRYKGIMWLAMTPLNEPWIYDDLYLRATQDSKDLGVYNWDIRDNKYLTIEEIEEFEKNLSDDEKEARLHGKFRHLSGLIYKQFDQVHRIKSFEIPKDWTRYCAMDYHPRVPCAILWCAVDPNGIVYFYDEFWIDKTIKTISEGIVAKETEQKVVPKGRVIDSLSATPDRITGSSPQREFLKCGKELNHSLTFRSSDKHWILGKNTVDEYLKVINGKPGVYFFEDKVPRTINSMTHYQWDEYAGTRNDGAVKEKPAKKYAHFADCVRYLLVMRPSYRQDIPREYANQKEYEGHEYTGYRT